MIREEYFPMFASLNKKSFFEVPFQKFSDIMEIKKTLKESAYRYNVDFNKKIRIDSLIFFDEKLLRVSKVNTRHNGDHDINREKWHIMQFKEECYDSWLGKNPSIEMSIENCTDRVRNAYRNMLYNRNTDTPM